MKKDTTHIGLDAHQETIHAAILLPGGEQAVTESFKNTPEAIRRFVRRVRKRAPGEGVCCYEAGPLGYGLQRTLIGLGFSCVVVAPSLIPVKPGDRIKTDRRDARKLAELLQAGLLTEVHAPTEEQEAIRDLCRAREAVKEDQKRIRHRISKFLLRRALCRAGRMAALLPWDRHAYCLVDRGGAPRLAPLLFAPAAHGLPGHGAERVLERRPGAAGSPHEGGQPAPEAARDRSRLALSPSSCNRPPTPRAPQGAARGGDRPGGSRPAAPPRALPQASRAR